jgi:methionyl-tRNA formyltransferase
LRVVFAGTPAFAAAALEALVAAGHAVALVLTQPDRPAGRGMRLASSAVAQTADRLGLPLFKPATLRDPAAVATLRDAAPDVMVVAAYGLILPRQALEIPRAGCLNIHASLLPRWRGAAPVQRAILAGDGTTGITIMQMDAGLDTGAILSAHELPIGGRDTAGSLTDSLAALGARSIVQAVAHLGTLNAIAQDNSRATYAAKIAKSEARLDWGLPAAQVDRVIRAFNPAPGAEARLGGEPLKIWEASAVAASGKPGEVLEAQGSRFVVACSDGAMQLHVVQRPGGKRLQAADFLRGTPLARGTLLEMAGPGPA